MMSDLFIKYLNIMIGEGEKIQKCFEDEKTSIENCNIQASIWEDTVITYFEHTIKNKDYIDKIKDFRHYNDYGHNNESILDFKLTFFKQLAYLKTLKNLIADNLVSVSSNPLLRNDNSKRCFCCNVV